MELCPRSRTIFKSGKCPESRCHWSTPTMCKLYAQVQLHRIVCLWRMHVRLVHRFGPIGARASVQLSLGVGRWINTFRIVLGVQSGKDRFNDTCQPILWNIILLLYRYYAVPYKNTPSEYLTYALRVIFKRCFARVHRPLAKVFLTILDLYYVLCIKKRDRSRRTKKHQTKTAATVLQRFQYNVAFRAI